MKNYLSAAVLAGAVAFVAAPASAATTLNFSNACVGACFSGNSVSQSYGDIAGVLNISYRSVTGQGSAINAGPAFYWGVGYGDLQDVIWGAQYGTLEIAFELLQPGAQITLNSVDFAAFIGTNVSTNFALYSKNNVNVGAALMSSDGIAALTTGHSVWSPNITSADGFVFHFGPDGFNVGIDNLTYTISYVSVPAVPEPTTWLSMILGFGLVGAAARRRATRSVAAVV